MFAPNVLASELVFCSSCQNELFAAHRMEIISSSDVCMVPLQPTSGKKISAWTIAWVVSILWFISKELDVVFMWKIFKQ